MGGASPYSFQSVEMVRTQWGQMLTILADLRLRQGFQVLFGQLLEDQIVSETAGRVAGAFFFFQDAEGGTDVRHDAGEIGDDFAAFGIVSAHAAQPEAVFLGAVEDRKLLLVDEFLALGGGEAQGVAVAFQIEE